MYYKITNHVDVACLERNIKKQKGYWCKDEYEMLLQVARKIREYIDVMCSNYGENRDCEKDLGGYVILFTSTFETELFEMILNQYGLEKSDYEYEEVITKNTCITWKCSCYLVSSDYGIIVFQPMKGTEDRSYSLKMIE